MIYKIADNILSPLGKTTEENFNAVIAGRSALKTYSGKWNLPESFCASLLNERQKESLLMKGFTLFESMVFFSVKQAIAEAKLDVANSNVVFILSTTKGNIELLEGTDINNQDFFLGNSAKKITSILGIPFPPIVVCNACISGLSAILLASHLLRIGAYEYAIVCGADIQNRFVVSGFQSLKALSPEPCRPFDLQRIGLNLGEAAATIILGKDLNESSLNNKWNIGHGVIRNDSYHISAPSKKGEGSYLTLQTVINNLNIDDLAFINAHGTATMFNDQMESVAIERAGLSQIPVNTYKGYYGHTMGAAGVLETILSMKAIDNNVIIGTKGFEELGVSGKISVSAMSQPTGKSKFIKMISGFGGCNAAIVFSKGKSEPFIKRRVSTHITHTVTISPLGVYLDGQSLSFESRGNSLITDIYKNHIADYPKYYKMDMLSRLGFVASELLLKSENRGTPYVTKDRAIIIFNNSSSLVSDKKYQETIVDSNGFFPSPSVFVYTLPNIVTGEIAIRNHYHGETSFYILPERNEEQMDQIIRSSSMDRETSSVLTGWLDYIDENNYIADLKIVKFNNK